MVDTPVSSQNPWAKFCLVTYCLVLVNGLLHLIMPQFPYL